MIENDEARPATADSHKEQVSPQPAWSWAVFCCALASIACLAFMIAPNDRLIGSTFMDSLAISRFLVRLGSWLPANLPWLLTAKDSFTSTNNIEFLCFIALAFIFYGAAALLVLRLPARANYTRIQACMWLCILLAGLMLIFAPFLLSHDIFVYADYGHIILTHHVNLYFTAPISVSNDPITRLDGWNYSVAAYGPLWLGITIPVAFVSGANPLSYLIGFRALALGAHLLNTWLVLQILRASGRSPRTVMLGTLLYALNPLALIESALGAHNDIEMITFLLFGILLCLRAERRGFARFSDYALPAVVFTLAILIKYTSLPVLLFYLALLARKSWLANAPPPLQAPSYSRQKSAHISDRRWLVPLFKTGIAGAISAGIALLAYAPFWIGHTPAAIAQSFGAPPSARFAENSIMRTIESWVQMNGLPPGGTWMRLLLQLTTSHNTWNIVSIFAVLGSMIFGIILLWRKPSTHTLAAASLFTLGALLIVTPWLFPWYATWLIALAAILLGQPAPHRLRNALIAFALAFSISVFFIYLDNNSPFPGDLEIGQTLCILGIPVLVFVVALVVGRLLRDRNTGRVSKAETASIS